MASHRTNAQEGPVLRVSALSRGSETMFDLEPDAEARATLAGALELEAIRKLRFHGTIRPDGDRDWRLDGALGATVVQSCVATLEPVVTRIDEPVSRRFLSDPPEAPAAGSETELTEDVDDEPLGDRIDLGAVLHEALALAVPAFPRAKGVAPTREAFAAPGVAPMSDDDTKPFAGLAGLRDKLGRDGA